MEIKPSPLLSVNDLSVSFTNESTRLTAVDSVSFKLFPGQKIGIVGESGSGKTVTALSILGLLPKPAGKIDRGEILYNSQNLLKMEHSNYYRIRGNEIAMIFQEPMTALNPVQSVFEQISEMFILHRPQMSRDDRIAQTIKLLTRVGIQTPEKRMYDFPHELSGGMRQRVMIAMALACEPKIMIADEPTTALDVTIQAQILDLLDELKSQLDMSIILITHDLGVVYEFCDYVYVMYAGQVVESAPTAKLFSQPKHPYTKGLIDSIPGLHHPIKQPLPTISGSVPSLTDLQNAKGCRFHNRCNFVAPKCRGQSIELLELTADRSARCCRILELTGETP